MGANSAIEWTSATWNALTGCTKISPGCKNCYAERLSGRLKLMGQPNYRNGFELTLQDLRLAAPQASTSATAGALRAPMHGRVTQVHATPGASVQAGTLLLVMEAMKMEHQVHAPFAGIVSALHASVGEQVAARQVLVEITA